MCTPGTSSGACGNASQASETPSEAGVQARPDAFVKGQATVTSAATTLLQQALQVSKLMDQGVVGLWTGPVSELLQDADDEVTDESRTQLVKDTLTASRNDDKGVQKTYGDHVNDLLQDAQQISQKAAKQG